MKNLSDAYCDVYGVVPENINTSPMVGDIVLCSWAKHFTLTVPLSTQVYKWVPANLMLRSNPAMD